MDLYEHQGKSLLREVGIRVPRGVLAVTPAQAKVAAQEIKGKVEVKAQVRTGGRGRAGGIRIAATSEQAEEAAAAILGMTIRGQRVQSVLVEEACDIGRELYAAVLLDRNTKKPLVLLSTSGGIEVEDLARTRPEQINQVRVDPLVGWHDYHGRRLFFGSGLAFDLFSPMVAFRGRLHEAFVRYEATLVEVNPLAWTLDGDLIALDAKISLDNNAVARRPELAALDDHFSIDCPEGKAKSQGMAYVRLEGEVGVLGNGAGLVMSSLDLVVAAGAAPPASWMLGEARAPSGLRRRSSSWSRIPTRARFSSTYSGG